jgi:hypothetical protein
MNRKLGKTLTLFNTGPEVLSDDKSFEDVQIYQGRLYGNKEKQHGKQAKYFGAEISQGETHATFVHAYNSRTKHHSVRAATLQTTL